jgi:hypothetical protein
MQNCKIHIRGHAQEKRLERGIEKEIVKKIINEGNDIKGKYRNRKYRKLGNIEVSYVPKPCNIFIVTVIKPRR